MRLFTSVCVGCRMFVAAAAFFQRLSTCPRFANQKQFLFLSARGAIVRMASNDSDAQFGRFRIPGECIFHRTDSSFAFVNLRPIVPGHVLVMPKKNVPHLRDLNTAEYLDLWSAVRTVQEILEEEYKDKQNPHQQFISFNVAVQDGRGAGQSVPHVHVHILPRRLGDFERNDDVYAQLEEWAPRPDDNKTRGTSSLHVPDDVERKDRTQDEMASEAAAYRSCLRRLRS